MTEPEPQPSSSSTTTSGRRRGRGFKNKFDSTIEAQDRVCVYANHFDTEEEKLSNTIYKGKSLLWGKVLAFSRAKDPVTAFVRFDIDEKGADILVSELMIRADTKVVAINPPISKRLKVKHEAFKSTVKQVSKKSKERKKKELLYNVNSAIEILESNNTWTSASIYLTPPDPAILTDEDSGDDEELRNNTNTCGNLSGTVFNYIMTLQSSMSLPLSFDHATSLL